jgi:hypothetical protein
MGMSSYRTRTLRQHPVAQITMQADAIVLLSSRFPSDDVNGSHRFPS